MVGKYILPMNDKQLQMILEYKMTQEEAFAFKLGLIYCEMVKRYHADLKVEYPSRMDPRKSQLFRYCWKLREDTKGKLKLEEYRQYIQAQMDILKNITDTPLSQRYFPGPNCLVGKAAWGRWVVWKKFFTAQKTVPKEEAIAVAVNYASDLIKTKAILENKLRPLNKETLTESMKSGQLFRLAMSQIVSPIFLQSCPIVRQYVAKNPEIAKLYEVKITEPAPKEAVRKYEELFGCLS